MRDLSLQAYCDDGSLLSLLSRHRTNNETSYRVVARTASNSLEYISCKGRETEVVMAM